MPVKVYLSVGELGERITHCSWERVKCLLSACQNDSLISEKLSGEYY